MQFIHFPLYRFNFSFFFFFVQKTPFKEAEHKTLTFYNPNPNPPPAQAVFVSKQPTATGTTWAGSQEATWALEIWVPAVCLVHPRCLVVVVVVADIVGDARAALRA